MKHTLAQRTRMLFMAIFMVIIGMSAGQAHAQKITNPLKANSIPELAGLIINVVLGLTGSVALIMFIYGGLLWMLSGGNADRVKQGRDTFIWSILGLVVIFSSYILVKFIFDTFAK
jgi:TRAP-type C4-dicarboxylate transport system permease small subunit